MWGPWTAFLSENFYRGRRNPRKLYITIGLEMLDKLMPNSLNMKIIY